MPGLHLASQGFRTGRLSELLFPRFPHFLLKHWNHLNTNPGAWAPRSATITEERSFIFWGDLIARRTEKLNRVSTGDGININWKEPSILLLPCLGWRLEKVYIFGNNAYAEASKLDEKWTHHSGIKKKATKAITPSWALSLLRRSFEARTMEGLKFKGTAMIYSPSYGKVPTAGGRHSVLKCYILWMNQMAGDSPVSRTPAYGSWVVTLLPEKHSGFHSLHVSFAFCLLQPKGRVNEFTVPVTCRWYLPEVKLGTTRVLNVGKRYIPSVHRRKKRLNLNGGIDFPKR